MSTQQLIAEAIALPLAERLSLAQALWQSIDADWVDTNERDAIGHAVRRDQELTSAAAVGRKQDEVMQAARRTIRCA